MPRPYKDRTGERFDRLVVKEFHGIEKNHTYWIFTCDCGNEVKKVYQAVSKAKNNACRECMTGSGSHAWKGVGNLSKDYFTNIKRSADVKNFEFDITMEYLWDLYQSQNGLCAFTGWPIEFHKTYRSKKTKTASLDRIDSSKGYVVGNLQWVHRDVNKLKKNMRDERFIELCIAVASKQT